MKSPKKFPISSPECKISSDFSQLQRRERTYQRGYGNIFSNPRTTYKWPKFPNAYQMPGWVFRDVAKHRHRDMMQRQYHGLEEDRYLSPYDGHLAKLVVQAAQDVYDGPPNSTWRRTFVRNISPFFIHVANYPFNNVPIDVKTWTNEDWTKICLKWIPACVGLLGTVCVLSSILYIAAL